MDTSDNKPIRTLLFVGLIAVGAATLVTASYEFSKDKITANVRARLLRSLHSVLNLDAADVDLNPIPLQVTDPRLGSDRPLEAFVITEDGRAQAAIIEAVAPDGYNAPIRLLIGIRENGEISGVRVLRHRETPGLGDAIEVEKSDWIMQFDGKSLGVPPLALWAVDKDEGSFDSITGATVTPRAVVAAVKEALLYFRDRKDELFAAALQAEQD